MSHTKNRPFLRAVSSNRMCQDSSLTPFSPRNSTVGWAPAGYCRSPSRRRSNSRYFRRCAGISRTGPCGFRSRGPCGRTFTGCKGSLPRTEDSAIRRRKRRTATATGPRRSRWPCTPGGRCRRPRPACGASTRGARAKPHAATVKLIYEATFLQDEGSGSPAGFLRARWSAADLGGRLHFSYFLCRHGRKRGGCDVSEPY